MRRFFSPGNGGAGRTEMSHYDDAFPVQAASDSADLLPSPIVRRVAGEGELPVPDRPAG